MIERFPWLGDPARAAVLLGALLLAAFSLGFGLSTADGARALVFRSDGRAADALERIGALDPRPGGRAQALSRSAVLRLPHPGQLSRARERLQRAIRLRLPPAQRARVLARLGLTLAREERWAEASQRLREAHDLRPTAPESGDWLLASARCARRSGDPVAADHTLQRLSRRHPVYRGRALLERATLALSTTDAVSAAGLYQRALRSSFDPDVAQAAALGLAASLEQLGDRRAAVRAIEGAEWPEAVLAARRSSLDATGDEHRP